MIGIADNNPILRLSNKLAIKNEILKPQNSLCGKIYAKFNISDVCCINKCYAYLDSIKVCNLPFMSFVSVNVNIPLIYTNKLGYICTKTICENIKFFNIPDAFNLNSLNVYICNPIYPKIYCDAVYANIPVIIYH